MTGWRYWLLTGFLAGVPGLALAGIQNTALPTFSNGQKPQAVLYVPGVISNNDVETDIFCTNLSAATIHLGVEFFDENGARGNSVSTGNGAALNVGAGRTVTFGSDNTAGFHEDVIVTLEAPVTWLRNGSARVVSTSASIACTALLVDALHTVVNPLVSAARPPTMAGLAVWSASTSCADGNGCSADWCEAIEAMPCSTAGVCLNPRAADNTTCDDGNPMTTNDKCTTGVCSGTGGCS